MLVCLGAQIGEVNISKFIAGHRHHSHAGHDGARGIGAVRGSGNEADDALHIAPALVVIPNRQQPRELTSAAGIGLHAAGREAGDLTEPGFQLRSHHGVSLRLRFRAEGMQRANGGPGEGHHFRSGIQFHGAGSERDHGFVEREVHRFQAVQVAEHFVLGAEAMENLLGQEIGTALQRC